MNASRLRKLSALTRGAAILSIGVGGCAKSEPIVNAPETQSSATTAPTAAPTTPRVVLNAPPQLPPADVDAGISPTGPRLNVPDGGKRPPFLNAPPRPPPGSKLP